MAEESASDRSIKIEGNVNDSVLIPGDRNLITFNKTEIIQISPHEIKMRQLIITSPYKGLKKFEPEDKDQFFGRDQFLKGLAAELEQTNLMLLLGASGSGKSSVVRAGLIPWLLREKGLRLAYWMFTPDQDPFESLYACLCGKFKQAEAQIARTAGASTLTEIVTTLRQPEAYWFIFIDQFEELFTTSQPKQRDLFIASLLQLNAALKLLGAAKDCPVKLVATMRADFLDRLDDYPALVKATNQHRPLLAKMEPDELRQAIEQPAAYHGVVFEAGLVKEITEDVQEQAGYLPLLQYALNLLWDTEKEKGGLQDRTLHLSTYRELGGVRGALQQRVDQIYGSLSEPEQLAAQRIFLKLVEIGGDEESGTEWKPVRKRAARSKFDTDQENRVLVRLINENLLVSDRQPQATDSTIEIAHEALLTSWTTLNTWIKENRQAIVLRNRLEDDVDRWQVKKAEDELWSGSKLEQALDLRKDPTFDQVLGGFNQPTNQFLDASLGLRDRVRKRQVRQARTIAAVSIGAVFLVGIAAIAATLQWREALRQKKVADLQRQEAIEQKNRAERERMDQYAANAEALVNSNPSEGLVNAIAAIGLSRSLDPNQVPSQILQRSLFMTVQASREMNVLRIPNAKVSEMVFETDGQGILTVDNKNIVRSWNLQQSSPTELLKTSYSTLISSSGILAETQKTTSSNKIEASHLANTFQRMDLKGTSLGNSFKGPEGVDLTSSLSPDGVWVEGSGFGTIFACETTLWNVDNYSKQQIQQSEQSLLKLFQFPCEAEATDYGVFSQNGDWYIGGIKYDDSVTIVNLRSALKRKLLLPVKRLTSAALASDGKELIVGDENGNVYKWKIAIGEIIDSSSESFVLQNEELSFKAHSDVIEAAAISIDGKFAATGSQDGTIQLWDLETLKPATEPLKLPGTSVVSMLFSQDGRHIASLSAEGEVYVWDTQIIPIEREYFAGSRERERLTAVSFSSDNKHIRVKANDNWAGFYENDVIFNLQGERLSEQQEKEILESMASQPSNNFRGDMKMSFSPDGTRLVRISSDGKNLQMYKVLLEEWLRIGCNRLQFHPMFTKPETNVEREAKATCEQYVWSTNQPSETPIAEVSASPQVEESAQIAQPPEVTPAPVTSQSLPTPVETTPALTVSPSPSPSPSSYTFTFPQENCGDKLESAPPNAFWYPVFIDNKSVEEVQNQYCKDAYSVSKREKTGKPSVQVASFSDLQKAEAFAREVGGEVGEPHQ